MSDVLVSSEKAPRSVHEHVSDSDAGALHDILDLCPCLALTNHYSGLRQSDVSRSAEYRKEIISLSTATLFLQGIRNLTPFT